jgi:hypothetical protein
MVGFILTAIGTLLLLVSLGGIAFGAFMAADSTTREAGRLFVIWWVPAVAAASGVLMRDVVTFTVGILCFLVAGAVFTLDGESKRPPVKRRGARSGPDEGSEETTKENKPGGYGKAAS